MTPCTLTVEFCYLITVSVHNGVVEKSPADSRLNSKVKLCFVFATFLFRLLLLHRDKLSTRDVFAFLTDFLGLIHGRLFLLLLLLLTGVGIHCKCQGLCLWPIKLISFHCDRYSQVLLILFFIF